MNQDMKKHFIKKHIILALSSFSALVLIFINIDPEGKPLVYIFVPVVLVWIFLFSLLQIVLSIFFKQKSLLRSIISFIGVSTVVLMLLLSGVNQLKGIDIILSAGLVIVSSFYFYRMWS
jgi:hypothetical protein